jgi:hypothetical protein
MEILQIVAGPLSTGPLGSDFVVPAPVTTPMNFGEILEKNSRAMKERHQGSVMIGGKRIKAGLDIGEILPEKDSHIRVEASPIWHGQIGLGARARFLAISSLCCLR